MKQSLFTIKQQNENRNPVNLKLHIDVIDCCFKSCTRRIGKSIIRGLKLLSANTLRIYLCVSIVFVSLRKGFFKANV